ncbi:MAG: aminoglycoside phosphotransferase family protein [Clostridiales bacterium]|nr:aminoglycoside phosphotransferase family protein [Clostridiales bacterium]
MMAERLSQIMGGGAVADVFEKSMGEGERGFSGAKLFRLEVLYKSGEKGSFICKKIDLRERMVMRTLTRQGHSHTPAAYSPDEDGEEAWMIQQDLRRRVAAPHDSPEWTARVADALAGIHAANRGRGEEMPWLPRADADYWRKIVTQISIDHFEREICENECFARQFEVLLPELRAAGERFVRDMTALYEEADSLTLTHGDLQTIDGDHVYNIGGKPYIIDFGFARYEPLYIDLVDYFAPEQIPLCHGALAARGVDIALSDFEERFRAVRKYPGFIYMFPSIMGWKRGEPERLARALERLLG